MNKNREKKCAQLFISKNRSAAAIAKALKVSPRTVRRIAQSDAFHAELDALGYTGDRSFARKAHKKQRRPKSKEYLKCRRLWYQLTDTPAHKRCRAIAERKGITTPYNTILRWAKDWRKEEETT